MGRRRTRQRKEDATGVSRNKRANAAGSDRSRRSRPPVFQSDEYITYAELDRLNQNVGELLHRLVDAYIAITIKYREHGRN